MTVVRRPHAGARIGGARIGGALLAAVALLGGCGEESGGAGTAADPSSPAESSSEPSTEPTETEPAAEEGEEPEPTSPACSEVWVAGQPFPQKYDGCFDEGKGRWVQAMVYRCSSGQHLVTYRRTFYAAKGAQVNETDVPLARDREFKKALATCGA